MAILTVGPPPPPPPDHFGTIAEALAVAVVGDTIQIQPGTYNENLTVSIDVTLAFEFGATFSGTIVFSTGP